MIDPTRQDIKKETKVSVTACNIINDIYHQLLDQYDHPDNPKVLMDVNKICVRLVFCLYADDSGIFGQHEMFHDYMSKFKAPVWNLILNQLFQVLNTPKDKRHKDQLSHQVNEFPYVNGGMFADDPKDHVEIPNFTESIAELVLNAGNNFDWSQISPTIFGALFESTLNPEERKTNGMHYTSVQNIHKVIDPLFLNQLRHELNVIKTNNSTDTIHIHAKEFQDKLASLTFFDPACGSGNFLTETYLCLRKLENEAIKLQLGNGGQFQTQLGLGQHIIEVSIHQFYGIEINDFAVLVAKTAMWIAESQMVQQTQNIINQPIKFLPLTTNPNIIKANALGKNTHWDELIDPKNLNYIISNPPFVGSSKSKAQREDIKRVMKDDFNHVGKLDFVSAWYAKSAKMMDMNSDIEVAMVSTNNITNGQQVAPLWYPLIRDGIHINFAYRRFKCQNGATKQAVVYCVIIGFSKHNHAHKFIVSEDGNKHSVKTISPYLHELPNILVKSRTKPLMNVPRMRNGSKPIDDGHLSKYSDKRKNEICNKYPSAKPLFRKILGANEFLRNKVRWCLWLKGVPANKWLSIPPVKRAVKKVRHYRLNRKYAVTKRAASIPYLFQMIRQPDTDYLIVPSATSKNRKYIPIGYEPSNIIVSNLCLFIPNANYYMFGILESKLNTLWTSLVSGRFGPSFRYSGQITYDNFPWPKVTDRQKQIISKAAKGILDARAKHKGESLINLYNPLAMPIDLQEAHKANDKAVMQAYGITKDMSKDQIFTKLLKMYQKLAQTK